MNWRIHYYVGMGGVVGGERDERRRQDLNLRGEVGWESTLRLGYDLY